MGFRDGVRKLASKGSLRSLRSKQNLEEDTFPDATDRANIAEVLRRAAEADEINETRRLRRLEMSRGGIHVRWARPEPRAGLPNPLGAHPPSSGFGALPMHESDPTNQQLMSAARPEDVFAPFEESSQAFPPLRSSSRSPVEASSGSSRPDKADSKKDQDKRPLSVIVERDSRDLTQIAEKIRNNETDNMGAIAEESGDHKDTRDPSQLAHSTYTRTHTHDHNKYVKGHTEMTASHSTAGRTDKTTYSAVPNREQVESVAGSSSHRPAKDNGTHFSSQGQSQGTGLQVPMIRVTTEHDLRAAYANTSTHQDASNTARGSIHGSNGRLNSSNGTTTHGHDHMTSTTMAYHQGLEGIATQYCARDTFEEARHHTQAANAHTHDEEHGVNTGTTRGPRASRTTDVHNHNQIDGVTGSLLTNNNHPHEEPCMDHQTRQNGQTSAQNVASASSSRLAPHSHNLLTRAATLSSLSVNTFVTGSFNEVNEGNDAGFPVDGLHTKVNFGKIWKRDKTIENANSYWDEISPKVEHMQIYLHPLVDKMEFQNIDMIVPAVVLEGLSNFRNLKTLKVSGICNTYKKDVSGMSNDYQQYVWRAVWLNPELEILSLEVSTTPDLKSLQKIIWYKMDSGWRLRKEWVNLLQYLGDKGDGKLHESNGTGEYLDPCNMEKARAQAKYVKDGKPTRKIGLKQLNLKGMVIDMGAIARFFDKEKFETLAVGPDCYDAGLKEDGFKIVLN